MSMHEDWPKRTFDFPGVTTVEGFARNLGIPLEEGAIRLLQYPYPQAVPLGMMAEAERILGGGEHVGTV